MKVSFELRGEILESANAGNRVTALLNDNIGNITLSKIQSVFPFQGEFHFRVKVPGQKVGLDECDYVWLVLTNLDIPIDWYENTYEKTSHKRTGATLEVQALAISIPSFEDDDGEDMEAYLDEVTPYIPTERQLALEPRLADADADGSAHGSGGGGIFGTGVKLKDLNLNNMKTGATNIWNKMKATAAQIQQAAAMDAATAKAANEMLAVLVKDLNSSYNETNSFHEQLLERLWKVHFPKEDFERKSSKWRRAGWQKEDPALDLKTSGILALLCLVYFGETDPYAAASLRLLQANQENKKTNYPFAIVGVNLTLLLAELCQLRNPSLNSTKESFGALFADFNAFPEVFCCCFMHFDATWLQRKAVRTDFGKIIGDLKSTLTTVLARGPKNVDDFRYIAADEGMHVVF